MQDRESTNGRIEVFVSYSRDDDSHREWVGRLADRLDAEPDLHVILDEYDLYGGKDLAHFMERCRVCDRVVVVITPKYVERADERHGGVGYETGIAAAQLLRDQLTDKFIPALREGAALPTFIGSKTYVDFRDDKAYEQAFADLLRAIRRQPGRQRPAKLDRSITPSVSAAPVPEHDAPPAAEVLTRASGAARTVRAAPSDREVAATHGAWEKIVRAVGIGQSRLANGREVPVFFMMNEADAIAVIESLPFSDDDKRRLREGGRDRDDIYGKIELRYGYRTAAAAWQEAKNFVATNKILIDPQIEAAMKSILDELFSVLTKVEMQIDGDGGSRREISVALLKTLNTDLDRLEGAIRARLDQQ
jgi:peroxiredoxin family protein